MNAPTRNLFIGIVLIGVVLLGYAYVRIAQNTGEGDAIATVTAFGQAIQKVPLLSPEATSTIASVYRPYVAPELIALWQSDLAQAPGKEVSSPWPDHIQITNISQQGSGYVITGGVVLMTSDGLAGVIPVVVQVAPRDRTWLIVAYQEQATTSPSVE